MKIESIVKPDFNKCLKAYPGVTVAEIYRATEQLNKEGMWKTIGTKKNE
jgi:hypothetical protein